MNIQHFLENGNQKFPLSTAALDFIQEQIKLVYKLTDLAGANVIIKNSTASVPGLVIFNGELLPLQGTPTTYIRIIETTEHLSVEGFDGNVRTTRIAVYSPLVMGGTCKPANQFTILKNISTLMGEFEEAKKHHLPKGSIIDWYGECKAANIPYGFVPCGWFGVGLTLNEIASELTAWQTKYGASNISISRTYSSGSRLVISSCNGQTVPLLTDKFIVQAGHSYSLGNTGGEDKHKLLIGEIPAHRHVYNVDSNAIERNTYKGMGREESGDLGDYSGTGSGTGGRAYSSYAGAGCGSDGKGSSTASLEATYHENRPPYFALYKLIKVI